MGLAQFLHLQHGPACRVGGRQGFPQVPVVFVPGHAAGAGDDGTGLLQLFRQAGQAGRVRFVRDLRQQMGYPL